MLQPAPRTYHEPEAAGAPPEASSESNRNYADASDLRWRARGVRGATKGLLRELAQRCRRVVGNLGHEVPEPTGVEGGDAAAAVRRLLESIIAGRRRGLGPRLRRYVRRNAVAAAATRRLARQPPADHGRPAVHGAQRRVQRRRLPLGRRVEGSHAPRGADRGLEAHAPVLGPRLNEAAVVQGHAGGDPLGCVPLQQRLHPRDGGT
mmetsp:Transcript_29954/g.85468  ORF Transcript_29954/g.85468 Transcript_29954/m.85468 type:complete len:206 (-) Transcript_29954:158-775(-)